MNDWLQWTVLALVQGLTEFLPVSSSAHLILMSQFAGWSDQGLVMDIAAHFGTLLAVLVYFRADVWRLLRGADGRLLICLLVATVPLALAGVLSASLVATHLRAAWVIALATAVFGVLLWWAQKAPQNEKPLGLRHALWIGLAQILALIPGTSRSGITMTAGMALGLDKTRAARFSFLLAIPAIGMSTVYGMYQWVQSPQQFNGAGLLWVTALSFATALLCIHWFLRWVQRIDFSVFMVYRLLLAALILWVLVL